MNGMNGMIVFLDWYELDRMSISVRKKNPCKQPNIIPSKDLIFEPLLMYILLCVIFGVLESFFLLDQTLFIISYIGEIRSFNLYFKTNPATLLRKKQISYKNK